MQLEFNEDGSLKVKKRVKKNFSEEEFPHIKVLKLIRELNFPIGRRLIAETLRGENNQKLKKLGLHKKEFYGSLDLYDKKDIQELLDIMISKGMIEIIKSPKSNFYPVIQITIKGLKEIREPKNLEYEYNQNNEHICRITKEDRKRFQAIGNILKNFNDEQKKAIIEPAKQILCIAGAGTGKTTVLTKRIEFLVRLRQVPSENILAITFTRKARQEMMQRLSNLIPGHKAKIETFNSFCEKILRKHKEIAYEKEFKVMDFKSKIKLVNEALARLGYDLETAMEIYFYPKKITIEEKQNMFFTFIRDVFSIIDHYHNNEKPITTFRDVIKAQPSSEDKQTAFFVYRLAKTIQDLKEEYGLRDYTDQLVHAINLFKRNPETIPRFQHILVDEYQDINKIQVKLLKVLNPKNIFVVGDPRQSIYGWRGSKIDYIINFKKYYPESKIIQLTKNYRSGKNIVEIGNKVIKTMNLAPLEPTLDSYKPAIMIKHSDDKAESLFIAHSILSQETKRKNIFILARTNKQLDHISAVLDQYSIKYLKRTVEDEKQDVIPKDDEVTLSTVHAIKGLEADVVYMIGTNSKMYPCINSDHPVIEIAKKDDYYDKYEEELRLLYVGMTRARKQLIISYYGKPSRFITDEIKSCIINTQNGCSTKKENKDIITRLREWRMETAEKNNIPPYMVFPDKTMLELAEFLPQTREELKDIYGMGPSKIAKYGEEIISIICEC